MKHLARSLAVRRHAAGHARAGADDAAAGDFRHRRSHDLGGARSGADRGRRDLGRQDRARGVRRQQRRDGQGAAGAEGRRHRREGLSRPRGCRCSRNTRRTKSPARSPDRRLPRQQPRHRAAARRRPRSPSIIDTLVGAGANDIGGINFMVSQASKLLDDAREKAIADARRKAEIYAKAAGVTLGAAAQHFRGRRARCRCYRGKMAARRWPPARRWRRARRRFR